MKLPECWAWPEQWHSVSQSPSSSCHLFMPLFSSSFPCCDRQTGGHFSLVLPLCAYYKPIRRRIESWAEFNATQMWAHHHLHWLCTVFGFLDFIRAVCYLQNVTRDSKTKCEIKQRERAKPSRVECCLFSRPNRPICQKLVADTN